MDTRSKNKINRFKGQLEALAQDYNPIGGNGEELMDLWEVSEPYEEDGITYVDADYNVRNENGKREDRTSKVPVSSKGYDEKKINDISSRMNNGKLNQALGIVGDAEMRIVGDMMMGNFTGDDDRWVTINGTHVFIENGEISKGPSALTGKKSTKGSSGAVNGKGTMDPKQLASAEKRRDELWNKQDHGKLSAEEESELEDLQKKISGHYSEKKKQSGESVELEIAGSKKGFVGESTLRKRAEKVLKDPNSTEEGLLNGYKLEKISKITVFDPDPEEGGKSQLIVTYSAKNENTGKVEEFEAHPYVMAYKNGRS